MATTTTPAPASGSTYGVKRGWHGPRPGRLRVVRAMCIAGKRVEVGEIVVLDAATASELISAGKLVREPLPSSPPPPPPPPPEPKPAATKSAAKE